MSRLSLCHHALFVLYYPLFSLISTQEHSLSTHIWGLNTMRGISETTPHLPSRTTCFPTRPVSLIFSLRQHQGSKDDKRDETAAQFESNSSSGTSYLFWDNLETCPAELASYIDTHIPDPPLCRSHLMTVDKLELE